MERHAGFIDYGYLQAASASVLGVKMRRLTPKPEACVEWLKDLGATLPGEPLLLRVYWYDGAYDPSHSKHGAQRHYFDRIANVPGVQLRLGHLRVDKNPKWQYPVKAALRKVGVDIAEFQKHFEFKPELGQKGVDTRITLDLVRLAQRHVYDVAVLVAGDRDLAEPVRVAQDEGRRVVVAIPKGAGLAPELKQLADEVRSLDKTTVEALFEIGPDGGEGDGD